MAMPDEAKALAGRKVIVGVTGGIAAYKSAELIRLLKKAGAQVQALMTSDATQFITPLTLGTLAESEVLIDIFPENKTGSWTRHITLGHWANLIVVAPATANTLAKMAWGFCDSLLTATILAARCPVVLCPAMDADMYLNAATQTNLERLDSLGFEIMEPEHGELASGLVGPGRLPEPEKIFQHLQEKLILTGRLDDPKRSLKGKSVLVTAGPTREHIDPVRFFSNGSTGTMGFALAQAASRRGANVTLIAGPTQLSTPHGVKRIDIVTAEEMHRAVQQHAEASLIIMSAAVSDYAPVDVSAEKLKKSDSEISLDFRRTPDILGDLGSNRRDGQTLVGFALETNNGELHAREKLVSKNLDWIVLNYANEEGSGFGTTTNRVKIIGSDGTQQEFPPLTKSVLADRILDIVAP